LSRNETRAVVRALVQAPASVVEPRTGRWATVTPVDDSTCRVEMDAVNPGWAAFGLGVLEAPFTLEVATPELRTALTQWATRFTAAVDPAE
jgi:hypothetical protein